MPSVIALDAMGSDKAPKPEIEGALQAARHHGVRVLLVGPAPRLKAELARYPGARRLPVEVVHASEVITMDDKVEAIRGKRDSSIRVGLRLVREGRAAGFVTAGNTGAAMATAKVVLGALPGVDRPSLAAAFTEPLRERRFSSASGRCSPARTCRTLPPWTPVLTTCNSKDAR